MNNKEKLIVLIILLIQIINLLYWCNMKNGYHMDEIFSYTASNFQESNSLTILKEENFSEEWHENAKDYLSKPFTVEAEERFSYSNVYYKQTLDVHPPFFYYGIHTMSSCFPEVFSKWIGIIPNIIYYLITVIVLYFLGNRMKFFGNMKGGIILVIAYGFSALAISSVVFIRMYALMTLWGVLECYIQMRIYEENEKLLWKIVAAIVVFLGVLTQYYS